MIQEYQDLFNPQKDMFSPQEELFKQRAKSSFGFEIKTSLFWKDVVNQLNIYLWAQDFKPNSYDEQALVDCFLQSFDLCREDYAHIYLNVHDWKSSLTNYAYGNGIAKIRQQLKANSKYHAQKVLLHIATNTVILACDPQKYPTVQKYEDEILQICYAVLKEYDAYDLLTPSDTRLQIIEWTDENAKTYNDVLITNGYHT